jgi:hypothetical protein
LQKKVFLKNIYGVMNDNGDDDHIFFNDGGLLLVEGRH